MNKEEKYTSLKLSKKIYDLAKKKGIKLESEYVYCKNFWLTKWKLMKRKDSIWGSWAKDEGE